MKERETGRFTSPTGTVKETDKPVSPPLMRDRPLHRTYRESERKRDRPVSPHLDRVKETDKPVSPPPKRDRPFHLTYRQSERNRDKHVSPPLKRDSPVTPHLQRERERERQTLDIGRSVYHFYNIYTVQLDTQCSCTDCLLILRCQLYMFRTVTVHPQELLFRYCMCRLWYVQFFLKRCTRRTYRAVRLLPHTTVCTYSIYKEAPEDGPLQSETCRADT